VINKEETQKNVTNKIIRLVIICLISVSLLVGVIQSQSDFSKLANTILSVNIFWFLLSDLPYFLQSLLMTYRLKLCFRRVGVELPFKGALVSHLSGMFFSNFSAGRIGYLTTAFSVRTELDKSLGVVTTISAIDAIAKGFMAGITITIFSMLFFSYNFALLGLFFSMFWIEAGILFLFYVWKDIELFEKIIDKIPKVGGELVTFIRSWKKSIKQLKSLSLVIFLIFVSGLVFRGLEWSILARACGFELPILFAMLLHPILTILRLIPITFSGLGVFELAIISLLPQYPNANLIAFGILDMINNALVVDIFGLIPFVRRRF